MPRTRKPKAPDVLETILDQFAGPARPLSQGEDDVITKRFKKARECQEFCVWGIA